MEQTSSSRMGTVAWSNDSLIFCRKSKVIRLKVHFNELEVIFFPSRSNKLLLKIRPCSSPRVRLGLELALRLVELHQQQQNMDRIDRNSLCVSWIPNQIAPMRLCWLVLFPLKWLELRKSFLLCHSLCYTTSDINNNLHRTEQTSGQSSWKSAKF